MTNPTSSLTEYQELRAEIRHYLDRRAQTIAVLLLVTTAVAGFAPRTESSFLIPTAALLVAFLWYDETRRMRAVHRIAAYLRLYIEPDTGLLYESRGKHHPIQRERFSRAVANGLFPVSFGILLWLMVVEPKYSSPLFDGLAITGGLLGVLLFGLSVRAIRGASAREEKLWEEAERARLRELEAKLTHSAGPARQGSPSSSVAAGPLPNVELKLTATPSSLVE